MYKKNLIKIKKKDAGTMFLELMKEDTEKPHTN